MLKNKLSQVAPYLTVAMVAVIVLTRNNFFGGEIIGWDNLATQLDIVMNLRRQSSGVWQEYQGLGLLAGMAHAADIVRLFFQLLLSLFVSDKSIRMIETGLMYGLGGIGVVAWVRHLLKKENVISGTIVATISGLFYLLSIGTVQNFWVPFEPYTWAFGMSPWLFYAADKYLELGSRKSLILFSLVSIIATPMGYLQTVYLVHFMILVLYVIGAIGKSANKKLKWKRSLMVLTVSLLVNSFWLLPQLFFFLSSAQVTVEAKMNRIASPEVALSNTENGGLLPVFRQEGYWLSLHDVGVNGTFSYLMQPWVEHLGLQAVEIAQYILLACTGLGIIYLLGKARKWLSMLLPLVLMLIILQGTTFPFGFVTILIEKYLPIWEQIFRSPFTKIIVYLSLFQSVVMGFGILVILKFIQKYRFVLSHAIGAAAILFVLVSCLVVGWPTFQGKLFYPRLNTTIPTEYKQLTTFFREEEMGRIVNLPVYTLWGWQYNDWGYDGSGFLWYGIEQPILDRAFDVWSPYNESFYNEFSTALYGVKNEEVARVLTKYEVRYVLLDESVIAPGQDKEILRIEETKKLARELGWQEKFHEGFLTVWDTGIRTDQFVSVPDSVMVAEGETVKARRDVIYEELGSYVSGNIGITYPFAALMKEEVKSVEYTENSMQLTASSIQPGQKLVIPGFTPGEKIELSYKVRYEEGKVTINWEPIYKVDGQNGSTLPSFDYEIPGTHDNLWIKIGDGKENAIFFESGKSGEGTVLLMVGQPIAVNIYEGTTNKVDSLGEVFISGNVQECWKVEGEGERAATGTVVDGNLRLTTKNASACLPIPLKVSTSDELTQVIVDYKSESGVRPQMCLDEAKEPYECVNEDVWSTTPTSSDWSGFARTIAAKKGEQYWLDLSSQTAMPYERERTIDYKVPTVARYPLVYQTTVGEDVWLYIDEEAIFNLQSQTLKVEVNSKPKIYDLSQFGLEQVINCDVLKRGTAEKNGKQYTADERGAVCDYMEMKNLDTQSQYLMRLRGNDSAGRSLKFFLHNTGSKRNDIEYLLGKGSFGQTFALLPWIFAGHYTLNVETRSFGQYTENSLEPVEVRYFPLEQLARAKIVPAASVGVEFDKNLLALENKLKIVEVKKTGTWLYRVKIEGKGLVKLGQGYDEGWIGVGISEKGGVDLTHLKVDGWANGWVVGSDSVESVVIFYWPQLLEYLGFALLGLTILVIVRAK